MKFRIPMVVLLAVVGLTAQTAEARPRGFSRCPTFVADPSDKTFRPFAKAFPGLKCSNNRRALLKDGYQEEDGDPNPVQNPELDTERVLRGRGEFSLRSAFRVSTTARIVTVALSNCSNSSGSGGWHEADVTITSEKYGSKYVQCQDGQPCSATLFEPGIYGITLEDHYMTKAVCDFEIRIQ